MAIDYTIPTYSRPDLGGDVAAYIKKYYEDKKTKEDEKANAVITEGAGVRSDQIYDSADPATRTAVGWGGGTFSPTEMSTGEPNEVAPRYDQWGDEVDMGNRRWGIAFNKALPNIVNLIPGYSVIKSIYDSQNKTDDTTTASSTDTGTTDTNVTPQLLSKLSAEDYNFNNMTGPMPNNMSLLSPLNYGTSPVATAITGNGGGGIIEAMIAAGADPNDPFGDPTGFM